MEQQNRYEAKTKPIHAFVAVGHLMNGIDHERHNQNSRCIAQLSSTRYAALLISMFSFTNIAPISEAQDMEPRAFTNTPVGLNFLIAGYGYTSGDVATDASLPIENVQVEAHNAVLAYVRSLDVWGDSGKLQLFLPTAWVNGTGNVFGQPHVREVAGLGDPKVRFSVLFYGAPALSVQDFKNYKQDFVLGGTFLVSIPLGQYDSSKLLNIGTNRWAFRPELGVSKAFGPLTLDLAGAVIWYTDNNDFLNGHTRAQDPIASVEGHLSYNIRPGLWIALDGIFFSGGRSSIDGVEGLDDHQKNVRGGITIALPVNQHNAIKLFASTGFITRSGSSSFNAYGIAWQYRWGAGL
jgi:hypothetical protein